MGIRIRDKSGIQMVDLPRTGHLVTGPFKNRTNLSSFGMVSLARPFFTLKVIKNIFIIIKWCRLVEKFGLVFNVLLS